MKKFKENVVLQPQPKKDFSKIKRIQKFILNLSSSSEMIAIRAKMPKFTEKVSLSKCNESRINCFSWLLKRLKIQVSATFDMKRSVIPSYCLKVLRYRLSISSKNSKFKMVKINLSNTHNYQQTLDIFPPALRNLKAIKIFELDLSNNSSNQPNLKLLSETFKFMRSLKNLHINFSFNRFLMDHQLKNIFSKMRNLYSLENVNVDVSKTLANDTCVQKLLKILNQNKKLMNLSLLITSQVYECSKKTANELLGLETKSLNIDFPIYFSQHIQSLKYKLESLNLNYSHKKINPIIQTQSFEILANLKELSLDLSQNNFDQKTLEKVLSNFTRLLNLKSLALNFQGNDAKNLELFDLTLIPKLVCFSLILGNNISKKNNFDMVIQNVKYFSKLESVKIELSDKVQDSWVLSLMQSIQNLEEIKFSSLYFPLTSVNPSSFKFENNHGKKMEVIFKNMTLSYK